MRTIKFRAWDKTRKEMHYDREVDGVDEDMDSYTFYIRHIPIGHRAALAVPYDDTRGVGLVDYYADAELMQFTGLTDKNGKEIYEGDIVRHDTGTGAVSFRNGCFVFAGDAPFDMIGPTLQDPEVIGNIHEHPELVEAK